MASKDETCPECGDDLEDTAAEHGLAKAASVGDYWCPSCEVGFEHYELKDVVPDEPEKDEVDDEVDNDFQAFGQI